MLLAAVLVVLVALAAALVAGSLSGGEDAAPEPRPTTGSRVAVADPSDVPDPVLEGARLPPSFRQLLPRDGIPPIYHPKFVAAADSEWTDSTLVIGVELDGDARAYSVPYLNRREMVIDRVAGIPVLVSW